jgi:outer membrane lipoprotein LolB
VRRLAIVCLVWLLGACAGLPPESQIRRTPRTLAEFEIDGRISIRVGQERHYANIAWRHSAERDDVLLTTPLGQGVAELSRDAGGARLLTSDRREVRAGDWEDLSERLFGSRLPLNDLPAWMAGQAPPAASGWHVEYLDYQSSAPDALPVLIEARRGDIGVRMKINDWVVVR